MTLFNDGLPKLIGDILQFCESGQKNIKKTANRLNYFFKVL